MMIFGNISRSTREPRIAPNVTIISVKISFEDPLPNSHWGETTEVHTLQLLSQSRCYSEKAHFETHWKKATPLSAMQAYLNNNVESTYNNQVI